MCLPWCDHSNSVDTVSARIPWALAVAVIGVGTASAVEILGQVDAGAAAASAGQLPDCRVGGEPTQPYGDRPPESSLRYATRPVVIGCATLPSGRRFELVGYQLARGTRSSLCIDQYDFVTKVGSGCGSNVVRHGGAIDATSVTGAAAGPAVVSGTVSGAVARVVVRSERGGRLQRPSAALVRVRDRDVLRAIAVKRPFGRYIAEVERGSRAVSAEAFDARPRTLGIAFFEGFRPAIGEGRACYTRPTVARVRLLEPAKVGKNRLRVIARYPGGSIGSIDVGVGGRTRIHADLAPTRTVRESRRRVVTLPIAFARRGTLGIDVTAEGVPLSERCSSGPLRRSATKTLVVRVH
jgi:hypothetical protein